MVSLTSMVIWKSSDLPVGCQRTLIEDQTGRWWAVRFPGGELMDAAIACYWRYYPEMARRYGELD